MKKLIFVIAILIMALTACNSQTTVDLPTAVSSQGNEDSQPETTAAPMDQPVVTDSPEVLEGSSGSIKARIFSAQETTINQQKFLLEGWSNRNAVVSANDYIITTFAEDTFSIGLDLEDGPNLIEVIISDYDGNEIQFELIVYVE